MWTYSQSTGALICSGQADTAYSGHGAGLDDPADQSVPDVGPIPQGLWTIGAWHDDPDLGPVVAALTPAPETDTFGRSGFFCHGDNAALDHSGSHGCIVAARNVREAMRDSGDTALTVTA